MAKLIISLRVLLVAAFVTLNLWASELEQGTSNILPTLLETYTHLHAHPELSYQEKLTASYLTTRLREIGFDVSEGVGDYRDAGLTSYGFVALLRNGAGPTVMVRTDLDGLPVDETTGLPYASEVRTLTETGVETGVMHACGHDLHMTVFLGVAHLLKQFKENWSGTLVMVGQPAEERGSGAEAMLADGLYTRFARPDFALAVHASADLPAGQVGLREGFVLASTDSVDIRVRGVGGHGAYPNATKDPIVLASQIVLALQTIVSRTVSPLDPAVVTVGSIHGGTKHNIIPDEVNLQLTVRSYRPEVRRTILDAIRRIAVGQAQAAGIPERLWPEVRYSENEYTPSTFNDPGLTLRVRETLSRELGAGRVIETDPVMAGEDFSRYRLEGDQVPSVIFWLGTVQSERFREFQAGREALPALHSSRFAPDPVPSISTGVRAMAAAVMDLMAER